MTRKIRGAGNKSRPMMLVAAPDGQVFEHPLLELAIENGLDVLRPGKKDLKPVPEGWDMMAMPGTKPIGYNPETGAFETVHTFTTTREDGTEWTFVPMAVAVHPPPGYVRTHHPAAEYLDLTHPDEKFKKLGGGVLPVLQAEEPTPAGEEARPGLPLWAYTAVGYSNKGPMAAFFLADETTRWAPELFYKDNLDELVEKRMAEDPDNPILKQLSSCAQKYLCTCAQNVFHVRWEGAVPMAPACTSACLGCLSKDPEWDTPTPQKRLKFSPKPDEIARVIAHHLENAEEPMMSFGQGCEGEPTMNGRVITESIRLARERTSRGIIHVNTNASRPDTIRDCARAGLNSIRISINTFDREMYDAYYRPKDYTFDDVMRTFQVAKEEGLYTCINFLIWPGWTDRMDELDRVSALVEDDLIQMIQLRNLCVDPGHYRTVLPAREGRGMLIGMKGFVDELARRHPNLRFGTFNPRLAAQWWDTVPTLPGKKPPAADYARGRPGVDIGPVL